MVKQDGAILLAHGSGGRLTHELVAHVFRPAFHNAVLEAGDDAAVVMMPRGSRLAMTTDTYVVKPLFFPGGDIGRLAVCGTVNDLSVMGARPMYLSAGFVLEEGVGLELLDRVVASMAAAAAEADVQIVTGDTKVVERGSADGLFINTAGVGVVPEGLNIRGSGARPGDAVIVSGPVGDHGIAVVSQRAGLTFGTTVQSDVAPLNGLVAELLAAAEGFGGGCPVHVMRDPTRGGLATTVNEIARQSGVGIRLEEGRIPVRPDVRAACEMLGFDPLYVANEGKLVAIVAADWAEQAVEVMRCSRYGAQAAIIGKVTDGPAGRVLLSTGIGGTRVLDMLSGEMLPRIC
jgi:hydrogenase expression/formation protein HypE